MKKYFWILSILLVAAVSTGVLLRTNLEPISQEVLDTTVQKAREKFNVPSAVVYVLNSEEILYKSIQGERILASNQLVTENDYFHIGSCSKSILSMIAGKQIEANLLNWDTALLEVAPELKPYALPEYEHITLEDLLLCEAGIQPFTNGAEEYPASIENSSKSEEEFAKYLLSKSPSAALTKDGARFEHLYSNASYSLAAYMLKKATEKTYETLLDEMLVEELGFSYHVGWPNTYDEKQPWGHGDFNGKGLEAFGPDFPYALNSLIMPAGDLSMTPHDFASLTQMMLRGLRGEQNYLSPETYQTISFGHDSFSYGVYNDQMLGHTYAGMDGSAGTFFCRSIIIPDSDLAIVIMINSGSQAAVEWITMQIAKAHYQWWWMVW
jgi:CubicO group peptidase (beta-lactamase class C family)